MTSRRHENATEPGTDGKPRNKDEHRPETGETKGTGRSITEGSNEPDTGDGIDVDDTTRLQARDRDENRALLARLRIPFLAIGIGLLAGATGRTLPANAMTGTLGTIGDLFALGGLLWMIILLVADSVRRIIRLSGEIRTIWNRELAKPTPTDITDDDRTDDTETTPDDTKDE